MERRVIEKTSESSNFWDQNAPAKQPGVIGLGKLSMNAQLAPAAPARSGMGASAGSPDNVKFGMLSNGTCVRCFNSVCGGVDRSTGRPLPDHPCSDNQVLNCYYPSEAVCTNNQPQRQKLSMALSAAPFRDTIAVTYNQPNYADAMDTFFAGYN